MVHFIWSRPVGDWLHVKAHKSLEWMVLVYVYILLRPWPVITRLPISLLPCVTMKEELLCILYSPGPKRPA